MINRNNNYVSANREDLKKLSKRGKRFVASLAGVLLTVSLLSGCGHKFQEVENQSRVNATQYSTTISDMDIEGVDLLSFNDGITGFYVEGSNLTDVSEIANYQILESIILSDCLVTDVSALESLPNLKTLNISGNSVQSLNIQNFKSLEKLSIDGNYALFTEDIINYCEENNIDIDITIDDVRNMDKVREMVSSLDLEGKSDIEKAEAIYKYVINHMDYDEKALKDSNLSYEYNANGLEHSVSGLGVCSNYAVLVDSMCEVAGINAFQIAGMSHGDGHAWNLIEIDGQYMLCDATWDDNDLPFGLLQESHFNKSGEDAVKFNKDHREARGFGNEYYETGVRSAMAEKSDGVDDPGFIDAIFEKIQGVYENIESSGIDMKNVASKIMMGLGAGSVVLLSMKTQKAIKKKINEAKKRKLVEEKKLAEKKLEEERRERLKSEREKAISRETTPKVEKRVEPIKKEEAKVKQKKEEPSIESILSTLGTNEEKISFLTSKSGNFLREAAMEQVDMETYNKLLDNTFKEEKIAEAIQELSYLSKLSLEERAIYRCQKANYLPKDLDIEHLTSLQRESIEATKRMYLEIDSKVNEYLRMEALKNQYITELDMQEEIGGFKNKAS